MESLDLEQLIFVLKHGITAGRPKPGDDKIVIVETLLGEVEMMNEIFWNFFPKGTAVPVVDSHSETRKLEKDRSIPWTC